MKIVMAMIVALTLPSATLANEDPSIVCLTAARRFMSFYIEEAKGTRHEAQIAGAIKKAGSLDKKMVEVASEMTEDKCALMMAMPDSSLRALAVSSLPERNGK